MAKDPIKALEQLEKALDKRVARVLNEMAARIHKRVTSQEFLRWKSGRKPIVVERARYVGKLMTVTVRGASGWKWGHVHIGPPGTTTIKPRKGMLAIPTDFAKRGYRGKALGPRQYGGTKIFAGIIWGQAGWKMGRTGGGLRQRRAAGESFTKKSLIPLFVLKGSVVVRRRIIPSQLIAWIKPQFMAALKQGGLLKT
ncbi:MAG: hypothetical protein PHZ19_02510 [Candidatus Thermoplasmatota archaeon]|nr:hypothetical protein [Candidatus Thermoplasmatota archaeon]